VQRDRLHNPSESIGRQDLYAMSGRILRLRSPNRVEDDESPQS